MEKMSFKEALSRYLTLMSRIESGESELKLLKYLEAGYRNEVLKSVSQENLEAFLKVLKNDQ